MSGLLQDTWDNSQHEPTCPCPVLSAFPAQNQTPKDLFKAQGGQHLVSCASSRPCQLLREKSIPAPPYCLAIAEERASSSRF